MAVEGGDGGGDDNAAGESLGVINGTSNDGWGRVYKGEEVLKKNI